MLNLFQHLLRTVNTFNLDLRQKSEQALKHPEASGQGDVQILKYDCLRIFKLFSQS